ncbi:putative transcription factor MYB-HB-like family [Heracleum sosnowskyi]|uniref:MYB transcription factor n=1 Tax=Heracleum sosnowskyi TaxID=360622 RepID=A0AAD8M8S0_9APIA|nr:putative transcription factor MYB-HB-like family [Heracleum sosnowskyi]
MVRDRINWSADEEDALRDGVTKHGVGKWRDILDDPELSTALILRTNVDLKDKWRNMNLKNGVGRNGHKPVKRNTKKTSRKCNKSAALTIAQREASAMINRSSEDGESRKSTVMHQQPPEAIVVYTRCPQMSNTVTAK